MIHNQPNWKFHLKVISNALDVLEAAHHASTDTKGFEASEAPLALEEARASLEGLKQILSPPDTNISYRQDLRKLA